jgi:hypothetical protein
MILFLVICGSYIIIKEKAREGALVYIVHFCILSKKLHFNVIFSHIKPSKCSLQTYSQEVELRNPQ